MANLLEIRVQRPDSKFTIVANEILRDKKTSLKAKGLYVFLLSLPPGASVTLRGIAGNHRDGKNSVATAANELRDLGYLNISTATNESGQFISVWTLLDPEKTGPDFGTGSEEAGPDSGTGLADSRTGTGPDSGTHIKTSNIKTQNNPPTPQKNDLSDLCESWNSMADSGIPKLQNVNPNRMGGDRLRMATARLADPWWVANYFDALDQIRRDQWRIGKNKRGWMATFEFFVRPDTVNKLLEEREASKKNSGKIVDGNLAGEIRPDDEDGISW